MLVLAFTVFSAFLSSSGIAQYLDDFPTACADATVQEALPGHFIRLGFVRKTPQGLGFVFPERQAHKRLEFVPIADNVGLIGQNPEDNPSQMIASNTPDGAFVVAQIFVGDENTPPIVTCLSQPNPLAQYQPSLYGPDFAWLDASAFGRWILVEDYVGWRWKEWWGNDFARVRGDFKSFWGKGGWHHRRMDQEGNRGKERLGREKGGAKAPAKTGKERGQTGFKPVKSGPELHNKFPNIKVFKKPNARTTIETGFTTNPRPSSGLGQTTRTPSFSSEQRNVEGGLSPSVQGSGAAVTREKGSAPEHEAGTAPARQRR